MLANLGAFLTSLMYGLPGLLPTTADPSTWPERPVVLPTGWRSIELQRVWVRGRPARLVGRHGADAATLELDRPTWERPDDRVTSIRRRPPAPPAARAAPAQAARPERAVSERSVSRTGEGDRHA
jgi:hypothetical protein